MEEERSTPVHPPPRVDPESTTVTKVCSRCGEEKRVEWFPRTTLRSLFLNVPGVLMVDRQSQCSDCLLQAKVDQLETTPLPYRFTRHVNSCIQRSRGRGCEHKEGITPDMLAAMWEECRGVCCLCRRQMSFLPVKGCGSGLCEEDRYRLGLWRLPSPLARIVSVDRVDASDLVSPYYDSGTGTMNARLVCTGCNSAKASTDVLNQWRARMADMEVEVSSLKAVVAHYRKAFQNIHHRADTHQRQTITTTDSPTQTHVDELIATNADLAQRLKRKTRQLNSYLTVNPDPINTVQTSPDPCRGCEKWERAYEQATYRANRAEQALQWKDQTQIVVQCAESSDVATPAPIVSAPPTRSPSPTSRKRKATERVPVIVVQGLPSPKPIPRKKRKTVAPSSVIEAMTEQEQQQ